MQDSRRHKQQYIDLRNQAFSYEQSQEYKSVAFICRT